MILFAFMALTSNFVLEAQQVDVSNLPLKITKTTSEDTATISFEYGIKGENRTSYIHKF